MNLLRLPYSIFFYFSHYLQAAILLLFNLASILLVFPAMISLDLRRRSAARADLLCCLMPESPLPLRNRKAENRTKQLPKTDKVRKSTNDIVSKICYNL